MALRIEAGIIFFLFVGAQGAELRHHHSGGGGDGALSVTDSAIIFEEPGKPEHSRTWRIDDIDNVSSSSPFELSISTYEKTGWQKSATRVVQFQLKERLAEDRYNDLWRRVNQAKGFQILQSKGE